tara:strand:+ start:440 stop:2095 length:1656 start_codon:yes stop_codon:yes gene_type:complete
MKTYWQRAAAYADQVLAGEIPACLHVKNACRRFVKDLQRDDLVPHEDGEVWCAFLEKLPHVKGKWAAQRQKFKLSEWQIFCTVNIYGWRWAKSGRRRFREAYIEVPRKNGKTAWIAGLGIGHLKLDNEYGAEVYCGATSEKQAMEVFRPAKQICQRLPKLREKWGLEVNAKTLVRPQHLDRFEPVIGNPGDGASPSCGIADEFHEHRNSDLVDTFITGMGSRENPMMLYITTAGADMGGPCYLKRSEVIQILAGAVEDDSIFGIIYTLDEGDQWDTEEALIKANPNYGVSVDPDFLKGQLAQARRSAARQNSFKTKHLNLWVGAKTSWMNMLALQACRRADLTLEQFKGRRCYIGIDLASKLDVASMAILFPPEDENGKWACFWKHYLPEDRVLEGGNTRYKAWQAEGWLTTTPGNVTDFGYIEDDLREMKGDFEIVEVPFDPFNATQFATRMREEGFPMLEYGAIVKNFSEPMKLVEALILQKRFEMPMDPVTTWMFGNVVAQLDRKDNIFPNKERNENKIDGIVALISAIGRAMLEDDDTIEQGFVELC